MKQRRENYFKNVKDASISIFYSGKEVKQSLDQNYPFYVNNNFYYLTNINQADAYLVLIKGNKMTKSLLFIEPYDHLKALWTGEVLTFEKAKELSGVEEVYPLNALKQVISSYLTLARSAVFGVLEHLYFDFTNSMLEEKDHLYYLSKEFKNFYPYLNQENAHPILSELRMVKDDMEVNNIKKALEITKEGILLMMKHAKPLMKEHELEAFYHFTLYKHGVRPSFKTIAASGVNATVLHYEKNNDVINDYELILFDLGVSYNEYASDISRTFPVNGKFTDRQKAYYEIVLNANKKVIEFIKPGVTNKEVNDYAKKLLAEGLIKLGKITDESELSKYYYHSIGHFLGLDVHDVGNYIKPFKEGEIFTVEPGLYIKEENIGIRIEDDILITKDGNINLSKDIIKEVNDIEEYMKK